MSSNANDSSSSEAIYLTWLCGEDEPFWNDSFWMEKQPYFTSCFSQAVWSIPPALIFWLLLPIYAITLRKPRARGPLGALSVSKAVLLSFLAVLGLTDLLYAALSEKVSPLKFVKVIKGYNWLKLIRL